MHEFANCQLPCGFYHEPLFCNGILSSPIITAKQTFTLLALQALLETIYRLCQVCCLQRPKIGQRFTPSET